MEFQFLGYLIANCLVVFMKISFNENSFFYVVNRDIGHQIHVYICILYSGKCLFMEWIQVGWKGGSGGC